MPAPYPKEFREGVIALAHQRDRSVPGIGKDLGIAESCLPNPFSSTHTTSRGTAHS